MLQPSPLRDSESNTLSHSGLTNVKTRKRMFYPEKQTYGQTRFFKDDHFQQVVQCVECKSQSKKQHMVPNVCHNRRPYRTQTLFQFSASPARILGTTENATFAHFMKKSMHLKTGFLSDYQVLFLLLNGPQIETSLLFNRSISIDL